MDEDRAERGTVNNEKLEQSISRTKSRIRELGLCNNWELFITLTIDPRKHERGNLKRYQKDLAQWLRDYNKKHKTAIKYVLVPEMHKKDGAWHMHGLIMGLPHDHLEENEHGYLDWYAYRDKFGYVSIDLIRNQEAISNYITKYVTKDLSRSVTELNANMYYCSKGLNRAKEIKRGTLAATNIPFDYTNDYCSIKWISSDIDIDHLFDD